jgi:hypothetical protein
MLKFGRVPLSKLKLRTLKASTKQRRNEQLTKLGKRWEQRDGAAESLTVERAVQIRKATKRDRVTWLAQLGTNQTRSAAFSATMESTRTDAASNQTQPRHSTRNSSKQQLHRTYRGTRCFQNRRNLNSTRKYQGSLIFRLKTKRAYDKRVFLRLIQLSKAARENTQHESAQEYRGNLLASATQREHTGP